VSKFLQKKSDRAPSRPSAAAKVLLLAAETALLLALALLCVSLVVALGPSAREKARFSAALRSHAVTAPLSSLLFDAPLPPAAESVAVPTAETAEAPAETAQSAGTAAEDENGIRVEPVFGRGFSGYMMIVSDPSQVIVGCVPSSLGARGFTVGEFAERFGAVAAINAGGFLDAGGQGNGASPDSLVVYDGQFYSAGRGVGKGFVGLDGDSRLHVGLKSIDEIREADIRYGVCFGPSLVINGVPADPGILASGVNPRTAIGQRSDGAVLMLVIDGRQVISLGASYQDCADIMLSYGAVNACNLDGGSSSLMYYDGGYINNCASVIGIRDVPTTFIVLPKED